MQTLKTRTTKMKRRLALFVAVIMALTLWTAMPLTASADETDSSTQLTYTVDAENNATITGYTGSDKATKQSINIPAAVGAHIPVTNIDAHALSDLAALTAITTNNPLYSVEDGVLFNADKTILVRYPAGKSGAYTTMPGSVTTIGRDAFRQSKLTAVEIPNSVTTIITQAFLDCAELSSVTISAPSSLTSIGGGVFARTKLSSFIIPESVTSIGNNVFHSTPLASITIPDGVTSIGNSVFYGCTQLTSVTISNESVIKSIGTEAFYNCQILTAITIPDTVEIIGEKAFNYCLALQEVTIPESVTTIGSFAFQYNSSLANVTILNKSATMSFGTTPFTSGAQGQKIWVYDSATSAKAVAGSKAVIMVEAPVISPAELNLNTTDNKTASLSVSSTDFLPAAQTETSTGTNTPTLKGWSSSNEAAATVDKNTGAVTAVAPGTALITATIAAHGGDKAASIPVTVMPTSGTPTKVLTVQNGTFAGTGSGTQNNEFANEATVTIVAGPPKTGQVFDKWELVSGGGSFVGATASEPTAVFAMPDAAATVRATYKTLYTATVKNGTGGGSYAAGATVDITADAAPSGQVFDKWTSNDGVIFDNATSPDTSFTMLAKPVTVTANYKVDSVTPPPAPTTYAVTVVNGTGSASYAENATVNITANAPASGKVFDTWTTTDGVTFADASKAATSFVMPAKAVAVVATYKDESVDPPVNPPTADNGWVYANGVWKFFKDGEAVTGWIHDGKAWYYLDSDGEMQTGWIYDQNTWYYLRGNGAMKTGWVQTDGSWYYLRGNGAMVAGTWLHDTDGSWYYLSGNGKMLTGKHKIGAKTYAFKTNGVWVG